MRLYVSTSCLKHLSILKILESYEDNDFRRIELGSSHEYNPLVIKKVKEMKAEFLIHNYFPPPKKSFIMNLASNNKSILKRSRELAKKAICLCSLLKCDLYSFHAGLRVDPVRLGERFTYKKILSYEKAFSIFSDSVEMLAKYAKKFGVRVAIEPNVVSKFNLIDGKNKLLLICEEWEIKKLFEEIRYSNVGILLDLGHTKVTSYSLKFDKDKFVKNVKKHVFALHVSENNGKIDQHLPLKKNGWVLRTTKMFRNSNIPIVLESYFNSIEEMKKNLQLIERVLG